MKTAALLRNTLVIAQLIAAGLSFAALMPGAAAAQGVVGNCETTATKSKWTATFSSTMSTSFVNMPEMATNITQGATDCVIVAFFAEVATAANEAMHVRATIDGLSCGPLDPTFVENGSEALTSSHAMAFLCNGVAPGPHTIRTQYRSFGGGQVIVFQRMMLVHYTP
jgi:hypothetical protein